MAEKLDMRVQKTYRALHQAFDELLVEKPFEQLTVNELCERAAIRRTTFYKHFADKYEYFAFYAGEMTKSFRRQIPKAKQETAAEYLLNMSLSLLRFLNEHAQTVRTVQNSTVFPILVSILVDQIREDAAKVLCREKNGNRTKAEQLATFYAGGFANVLLGYLKKEPFIREAEVEQLLADLLERLTAM